MIVVYGEAGVGATDMIVTGIVTEVLDGRRRTAAIACDKGLKGVS